MRSGESKSVSLDTYPPVDERVSIGRSRRMVRGGALSRALEAVWLGIIFSIGEASLALRVYGMGAWRRTECGGLGGEGGGFGGLR